MSSRENVKAFAGDPDQPLLLSLENYDPETEARHQDGDFRAADAGALQAGRACRDGGGGARRLAQRNRRDPLAAHGAGHRAQPRASCSTSWAAWSIAIRKAAWETADRYLSGDVRAKLAAARAAAALDASYQRNIEALEAVQPADLQPGDIEARLGSSWIPATDIRDFVAQLLDTAPDSVRVAHAEAIATWTLEIDWRREVQRQQHDDARHGALSRVRPDRGRAQRPHADRL